jgi:hypothetical protein
MSTEDLEGCNGCYIRFYSCLLKNESKKDYCPCKQCLIKGVCRIKCDERVDLWNSLSIYNEVTGGKSIRVSTPL